MTFPIDSKPGDLFWMNSEPIRITAWNYTYGMGFDRFFDIMFIGIAPDYRSEATMLLVPMGYDFYDVTIRRMSSLESELF
jgi:hypothetical protein